MKERISQAVQTQKKIKVMFKIYFLFSSTVFTKNIKTFFYIMSTNDEKIILNREIIKIIYKIELNKTLKINKIINQILRRFIDVTTKWL